jgi:general stress protein 26
MQEQKQKVFNLIKNTPFGVVASVNPAFEPQAALVAISQTDNLEIIFGTLVNTRKYMNLQHNPKVAFVIGSDRTVVQLQGVASEIIGEESVFYRNMHVVKHPESKKYFENPEERWFRVTPSWIRYTDHSVNPMDEFEINF